MRPALKLAAVGALSACSLGEPPAPDASPSIAVPDLPAPRAAPDPAASTPPNLIAPGNAATPPPPWPVATTDPGQLPQTRAMPQASGRAFDARAGALWDAIVRDDPGIGMPFFFPLAAYMQVKDVPNPASDWRQRLVAAYRRDIHALHLRLSDDAGRAQWVALDVPESRARWVEPGEEWNKIGYYRVFGSTLRYAIDGIERTYVVQSLISWRGEWYVVHLR